MADGSSFLLTVAEALELPALRRTLPEVLAGQAHLDNRVRWVHVLDVPPANLLRGGELILSTGAGPGHDPVTQRRFVEGLREENAAALLIELGLTYRSELPASLIKAAESVGLPLIATHRPTRFVDLTEAIHGALVDQRLELLRSGEAAAGRLIALVLGGAGLPELLQETARAVGNPVLLENVAGHLIGFAVHEGPESALLDARDEYRGARHRGETSDRGHSTTEIRSQGREWGHLIAFDLDRPLTEEARLALDKAATAIALALLQEENDEQVRARIRGSFLADLMQVRLSEADAARRAAALGFPRRHGRLLPAALAFRSERWSDIADSAEAAWGQLMPALRTALGIDRAALLGIDRDKLLLVVAFPEVHDLSARFDAIAAELRRPLARRGLHPQDVTIAFGHPEREWLDTGHQLARVAAAVGAARAAEPGEWYDARRSTVLDFLYALRDSPALASFVRDQLGPLADTSDPRDRELLRTLEAFVEAIGSKAEAARLLHLERQSLYLRLERLESMLGADLDDAGTLLGLHLAVRALRMGEALEAHIRRGGSA